MTMILATTQDIINLIISDPRMIEVLNTAKSLNLPDWWIGAGFIRNKIWDHLHGFEKTFIESSDIDVCYFDPNDLKEETEKLLEIKLSSLMPNQNRSVKNQARMHVVNNLPPYKSTLEAISNWPETSTAIAVKLDDENNIIFKALYGIEDLLSLTIRPTPVFKGSCEMMECYKKRVEKKNWVGIWSKLKVSYE